MPIKKSQEGTSERICLTSLELLGQLQSFFSNNTFKISNNKITMENPLGNLFTEVWIVLLSYPCFPEPLLHYLLIMADYPPSFQKCTSYPDLLFQDVWQLSMIANVSCKAKKSEWREIECPHIRGIPGEPRTSRHPSCNIFHRCGTSVISRAGL